MAVNRRGTRTAQVPTSGVLRRATGSIGEVEFVAAQYAAHVRHGSRIIHDRTGFGPISALSCVGAQKQLDAGLRDIPPEEFVMAAAPGARSARNVETRKKKAARAAPRKVSINLGNTIGARTKAKKLAGKKRSAAAKAKAAS